VSRIAANPPDDVKRFEQARSQIAEIAAQENDLERELVKRSPNEAQQRASARSRWEEVRTKLRAGDAAVEYVRYKVHNGRQWSGKSYYAALVITPEMHIAPTFILLGDASELECGPINNYRQIIGMSSSCLPCSDQSEPRSDRFGERLTVSTAVPQTPTFYDAFWKPLEPALGSAKRIYLSTDGVLSQVSMAAVLDDSGKLLLERYDLRLVISTKDLLLKPHPARGETAVLIGDPNFTATIAEQQTALASLRRPQSLELRSSTGNVEAAPPIRSLATRGSGRRSLDLMDLTWPELSATKLEVEQIEQTLVAKAWHVEMYTELAALEEVMKQVRGPRLLHVATHGFFLADENQDRACGSNGAPDRAGMASNRLEKWSLKEDPMLRSGLVFTGANRIAGGEVMPEGMDDGILTAYEAMELDLEGTELVVLSACETGLGQIQAGEGVFGLRRALQVAGAQSVMMTMWEVPDVETQRLMKLFYGKWLSGTEKHQALREAQLDLRQQIEQDTGHDSPQKWAAFVLVGP
jgi:CHAT domain-containing protein